MDFIDLIRIGLRRWWLIALPVLLSAVIAIPEFISSSARPAVTYSTQIRYSAAQALNLPARLADYTDVWTASERTVDALTDWLRSSSFRAEVGAQLGEAGPSLDSLQIAADNARAVGVIYLYHRDAEALSAIAEAAVQVLSVRNQIYFPQLGGEAAQITILDTPAIGTVPPGLLSRLAPLIRMGVALILGLALALLAEFIDPTVYHQNDLRRLGMPIIASIPRERA